MSGQAHAGTRPGETPFVRRTDLRHCRLSFDGQQRLGICRWRSSRPGTNSPPTVGLQIASPPAPDASCWRASTHRGPGRQPASSRATGRSTSSAGTLHELRPPRKARRRPRPSGSTGPLGLLMDASTGRDLSTPATGPTGSRRNSACPAVAGPGYRGSSVAGDGGNKYCRPIAAPCAAPTGPWAPRVGRVDDRGSEGAGLVPPDLSPRLQAARHTTPVLSMVDSP